MKRLSPLAGPRIFQVAKLIGRKNYSAAIQTLEDCIARDPRDVASLELLAHCYRWSGSDEKAIRAATKALAVDPNDFGSLRLLSEILANRGEHGRAIEYVRRGIEQYPEEMSPVAPFLVALAKVVMRILRPRRPMRADELAPWAGINAANREWFHWAKRYLAWYDSGTGSRTSPVMH